MVIIADRTAVGDQVGFLLRIRAAIPAMCGVAIEVPDSRSHRLPSWFAGETAASTSTPGAMMSGFSRSPPLLGDGPREENAATAGASALTCTPADSAPVGPAVPAMYALIAAPAAWSTWIDGTKWKSALRLFADGL